MHNMAIKAGVIALLTGITVTATINTATAANEPSEDRGEDYVRTDAAIERQIILNEETAIEPKGEILAAISLPSRQIAYDEAIISELPEIARKPDTAGKTSEKAECENTADQAQDPANGNITETTISPRGGVAMGPSGKETWYNLDMSGVIYLMRHLGYGEDEYPYWIRDDGAKMFGDYVMVAADLSIRPKGMILECSLGTAMVVDTGDLEKYQLDVAVDWV